jgi:hypothetical protein
MSFNPLHYKSLINRTIDKNRAIHANSTSLSTNDLKIQQHNELLEYITILPVELKRLIFKFIDIDTRLNMLLDKRPYLLTGENRPDFNNSYNGLGMNDPDNPMANVLNPQELLSIYLKGFLHPLYYYQPRARRWFRRDNFNNPTLFPKRYLSNNRISDLATGLRLQPTESAHVHAVHSEFQKFRSSISYSKTGFIYKNGVNWHTQHLVPVLALSLLLNTDAYDIEINYYLRKKAFNFIYELSHVIDSKIEENKVFVENQNARNENSCMSFEDNNSRKFHNQCKKEDKKNQHLYKRLLVASKIRFKPTLLLLKKRNKIITKQASIQAKEQAKIEKIQTKEQAKEQSKIAKIQAKEQAKIAKIQAKEQTKQAKEQAKLAKFQTKEIENFERSIHKKILQNILKKRKLLIRNNKL